MKEMSNILLTGATGMIGKGVLLECLRSPRIKTVTLINRSPVDIHDSKIREILLEDFTEIDSVRNQLENIDGCFHCMGVSALGMSEEEYTKLTFVVSRKLADMCFEHHPGMTFNYVSGAGTESTERSRQMWARVKGKTENYILAKGFTESYMFRPGFIIPENGIRSRTRLYNIIYTILKPLFPLLKSMKSVTTTTKIGLAMINTLSNPGVDKAYLSNGDINKLSRQ